MIEITANAISLAATQLGSSVGQEAALAPNVASPRAFEAPNASSMTKFENAMQRAEPVRASQSVQPVQVAQLQNVQPVQPAQTRAIVSGPSPASEVTDNSAARQRTLDSLDLESNIAPKVGPGESILDGMSLLRGAFDSQQSKISAITDGGKLGVSEMMALQVEVVKYSLLIDVTSKLTGKTTQAFDTLMKGQ